jgi:hypothetical protein
MCFGAMRASKANTKVTKKSVLCTLRMVDHYIDENLLTIAVIGVEND